MNAEPKEIQDLPQPEEELAAEQTEAARGGYLLSASPSSPFAVPEVQCPTDQFKK